LDHHRHGHRLPLRLVVGTINGWVMLGVGQRMTYDVRRGPVPAPAKTVAAVPQPPLGGRNSINRVNGDTYCVQTLITGVIMPFVQSVITLLAMVRHHVAAGPQADAAVAHHRAVQ